MAITVSFVQPVAFCHLLLSSQVNLITYLLTIVFYSGPYLPIYAMLGLVFIMSRCVFIIDVIR